MKLTLTDNATTTNSAPDNAIISPQRMTQAALAAIRRAPALLQCRVDSLLEALTLCMEAGLEPDGRHAHLLAEGGGVRVVFDWKGLVALGRRHGVEAIHADIVCANDQFSAGCDGGAKLNHQVDYRHPRGEAYAAYCYYILEGDPGIEIMTLAEIERERAAELAMQSADSALAQMWERDWQGMAKRAVIARAALRWPAPPVAAVPGSGFSVPGSSAPNQVAGEPEFSPEAREVTQLQRLREFMRLREISEASMLDYLKEEGRIADHIASLDDVPEPVIDDIVTTWVEMTEEIGNN